MYFLTLFLMVSSVCAQFDIVAKYPILDSFDQEKCLKGFTPKDVRDGIKKITDFLSYVEEHASFISQSEDFYLLDTEIDDLSRFSWTTGKQPYVIKSKLTEFPSKCRQLGGTIPEPTTELGVAKLRKWLTRIGSTANVILPKIVGN
jgi:hypothetical protein